MNLPREIFLVVNDLQASYQALESSLQFVNKYGDEAQKESASRRLASARPLKGMAADWAARYWKGDHGESLQQDLKRHSKKLLLHLKQYLEAEAERLESALQTSELPGQATVVEMLASMGRQADTDDLVLRGCVTMATHGDPGPLEAAIQGHANPEPRLLALRHFESMLLSGEPWEEWDLMSLRARILTLPELMRHEATAAELLSDTLSEGIPELTPEAAKEWARAGFSAGEGAVWLRARFTPEEAGEWWKAGIGVTAQALDWSAMSVNVREAASWWRLGFLPEEARCYLAAGLESAEASEQVRHAFGSFENLRPWIRARFSIEDALAWKEKGARSAEQAAVLRDQAALAAPLEDLAALHPGPALLFWGRIFSPAHAGFRLHVLPSGDFFLAARESLQSNEAPEAVRSPEMLSEWRHEIKKAAEAQSLSAAEPGSFFLAAMRRDLPQGQKASLFWGAEYGPQGAEPWAEAMDYMPSESWEARFKRKADEWGESGEISVLMGRGPKGGWLAALGQSLRQSEDGAVLPLAPLDAPKNWRDSFEDFSRIMDLPLRKPRWMLGLADFSRD